MNICVYGASSNEIDKRYIEAGELLGEEMAKRGHNLIFGGGAAGLMGDVARGVTKGGGKVIGVAPSFFNVDGVFYDKCDDFHLTETMRERKQLMEDLSEAFIMTPGGIGTYEEFFEILTLKQLSRHSKAIAIFNTMGYYDHMEELMQSTAEKNFMRDASLKLYETFENPAELLDYIEGYTEADVDIYQMKHLK